MQNISGFGLKVRLRASKSVPGGHTITRFADDVDPMDIPTLTIAATKMGLNGDLIAWAQANQIPCVLAVIPGSNDDELLSQLLEANRVGRGKQSIEDEFTFVISYPDGKTTTLSGGALVSGIVARSVSADGRLKTNVYAFNFENKVGT